MRRRIAAALAGLKSASYFRVVPFGCLVALALVLTAAADDHRQTLDEKLHHLRIEGAREWAEFSETPESGQLEIKFRAAKNGGERTLRLRQQDIKEAWHVAL